MALGEKAQAMLADLPPYEQDATDVQVVISAIGNELQRYEDLLDRLRAKLLPSAADDEFRTLGIWELTLQMPVEPDGKTVLERRDLMLGNFRTRKTGYATRWVERINEALGTDAWTHEEVGYVLIINLPDTSLSVFTVDRVARHRTPAHLGLLIGYPQGFVVGEDFRDEAASVVGVSMVEDLI